MSSFSPVHSVGDQIGETIRQHRGLGRGEIRRMVVGLLEEVGFRVPNSG